MASARKACWIDDDLVRATGRPVSRAKLEADDLNSEGPFAYTALDLFDLGLAVIPVGGDDGKKPLVKWANVKKRFPRRTLEAWRGKFPDANIGVLCALSGVFIVDIDDPEQVPAMLKRFGDTPLVTGTPSGGVHLWYRANGERCGNLRGEGLAVDLKGIGGFIVVPPSVRATGEHRGRSYNFVRGSWDDLECLPSIRPDSTSIATGRNLRNLHAVIQGSRNATLFWESMKDAPVCDGFEALLDVARTINDDYPDPLSEVEVRKTAESAWGYEQRGENWIGHKDKEPYVKASIFELDLLLKQNTDALLLLMFLRANHASRTTPTASSIGTMPKVNSLMSSITLASKAVMRMA